MFNKSLEGSYSDAFCNRTASPSKMPLQPCIAAAAMLTLSACGGGSSSAPNVNTALSDAATVETSDTALAAETIDLNELNVSFTLPQRLQVLGTALTARVTAGGVDQPMQAVGQGFETRMLLNPEQQLIVYVAVRRLEDGLLLAAADTTAWLGSQDASVSLPEQQFVYDFDQDGDGVSNIVEIERGTSPLSISLDFDADGQPDDLDSDDDNDGVADNFDAFPFNGQEFEDTDNDGIGNNSDTDDDGDGVLDADDAFPVDASEVVDSDLDGIGDNADTDADGNGIEDTQEDSDGDGVPDPIDLFPDNSRESADADGDGIGDNADPDDDNNGIRDFREGSQIIIPYVDDANISIDGRWDTGYRNNRWFDEWGKAVDDDSFGNSLSLRNLNLDNSGRYTDYNYTGNFFEMLHDGTYLYLRISISNEELENWFNDSTDMWQDDSVEIYLDVGYDQFDAYGNDDYQRIFRFRDDTADPTLDGYHSAAGMVTEHATSYRYENNATSVYSHLYEIRIELDSINLEPGDTFGLEVATNDDDDGGDREAKWGWWAPSEMDVAWFMPSVFGRAKLQPTD